MTNTAATVTAGSVGPAGPWQQAGTLPAHPALARPREGTLFKDHGVR